MITSLYHRDPEVRRKLFDLVDRSAKVLMVCGAHADEGVDVSRRRPLADLERYAGDLVDTVVIVDDGDPAGLWRDPLGDLCAVLYPDSKKQAGVAATGYVFMRGRTPLAAFKKDLWDVRNDVYALCSFAATLDPDRTPPPQPKPDVEPAPKPWEAPRGKARPKAAEKPPPGREPPRPKPPPPSEPPPTSEMADDPYAVLRVNSKTPLVLVRKAWIDLVAQYHPDKVAHLAPEFRDLAERRTRELNAAYDAIKRRMRGEEGGES